MGKNFNKWLWAGIPFVVMGLFLSLPLPDSLSNPIKKEPIQIVDRQGKGLYTMRASDFGQQEYIDLKDIPYPLIKTLLIVEDQSFYHHFGISLKAVARALWQNTQAGKIVSGGSTLTQQLIRNRLQPKKRNYAYKLKEMLLAIKLETRLSKQKILEDYLNNVYFGHQAYGIQAAAHIYFSKNVSELSLAESSFLVGLIQSPTAYDPFTHSDLAKKRHQQVIQIVDQNNIFKTEEIEALRREKIHLASGAVNIRAPHFVMWVLDTTFSPLVGTRLIASLQEGKMSSTIKTTLDLTLQSETERIVQNQLEKLKDKNVTAAAVVVLDATKGEVLAMVGSGDYFDNEHDGAVNVALSARQPGSTLKPFTYALALQKGDTAATTVADIETQFFTQEGNPYLPRNYDYSYHGLVRYREALANSYNIAAVKVLEKVGVERLLYFLKEAGITTLKESPDHYGISLTLGSGEVKLLELTQAYAMLARGGVTVSVKKTETEEVESPQRILDERIAWLITDILSDDQARLPEFGENGPLNFEFPVAAKTGTTRNSRDNWTIGYTPERVVGVWVGNADNSPMKETSGITGAGPIFHDIMIAATKNTPRSSFQRPSGMVRREICRLSGKVATPYCPQTLQEWFIENTIPLEPENIFSLQKIDLRNGLQGESCPPQYVKEKTFATFPPELKTWARENGWPEIPTQKSPLCHNALLGNSIGLEKNPSEKEWMMIEKPNPNESFLLDPLIPDKNERVIFQASAGDAVKTIEWRVNGKKVGLGKAPDFNWHWTPAPGRFKIEAISNNQKSEVMIEVLDSAKRN